MAVDIQYVVGIAQERDGWSGSQSTFRAYIHEPVVYLQTHQIIVHTCIANITHR